MTWDIDIQNIAGIRRGSASIQPGINAVRASNWQGKSSFLEAIRTAAGIGTSLTEGEAEGRVSLHTETGESTIELARVDDRVTTRGEPLLADDQDRICVNLFAFLDETNEIRRLVHASENLEDVLTRPLDFENIDERIAELRHEREQVETELDQAQQAANQLAQAEAQVTEHEQRLDQLNERRDELGASSDEVPGTSGKRNRLSDARAERERLDNRMERLQDSLSMAEAQLGEKRDELENLTVPDASELTSELNEVRSTLEDLERDIELVRSVYEANQRVLDEERTHLVSSVDHALDDDRLSCWVCGSDAATLTVKDHLAELRSTIESLQVEATRHREAVEELEAEEKEVASKQQRARTLERDITDLEATLADREESLESAQARRDELESQIEELAAEVEERDEQLVDLETEIKYTETELEAAREEVETLENRADRQEVLESELEDLIDEIEQLRTRKETLKQRVRDAFDESIEDILDRFDVGFESARLTSQFDLVVARDGREAALDALSEGERELLGIVAALAGHEAYDVDERLSIILLDGIGGLANENLHSLVEYLTERAEYLVLTTYPEHDRFDGHELDPTAWEVVSHERPAQA